MSDQQPEMSDPFEAFRREAPGHAQAWMGAVRALDEARALERKTEELASLAVAAALRLEGEVPMQVQSAKGADASRQEIISAVLVGLPLAGRGFTQVLPATIAAYNAE